MFSTREILGLAVKLEKNGELFYRSAGLRFSAPSLVSLLRWLADEELRHMEWFLSKRSELKPEIKDRDLDKIGDELLHDILGDQTFSLQEVDLSTIHDDKTLVDIAIEFENDTILFYEMLRNLIEDKETTDKLNEIIEEENSHVRSLRTFRPGKEPSIETQNGEMHTDLSGRSS